MLVTGAGGFLGRHLLNELLSRGYAVRALVRSGWDLTPWKNVPLKVYTGDITRLDDVERAVDGCPYVIHAAAMAQVNPARSPKHWQVNLGGTENVLQATRQQGIQRLVYVGTANVFGFGSLHQPGNEEQPYLGNRYGLDYMDSKRADTDRVLEAVEAGRPAVLVQRLC